eukprot:CAMPEP_0198695792 /NCGR_PEP_ID=MMETSP1468-20131203/294672_1 /TAXON_ID=1461545 /ORGANISM="Mantoniella sp, Strain CCMP1436" /LENGTH=57 /DNA_ID=CAMNT_0044451703 /DNA_START=244 /DNA_END=414 /DNA_ORIENTATION=+
MTWWKASSGCPLSGQLTRRHTCSMAACFACTVSCGNARRISIVSSARLSGIFTVRFL